MMEVADKNEEESKEQNNGGNQEQEPQAEGENRVKEEIKAEDIGVDINDHTEVQLN